MVLAAPKDMRSRFAIVAAAPVALLLATVSVGGLMSCAYARETAAWTAQALGQDWFDLVIAVPWLVVCGVGARSGSYRWSVLLAGAYAYVVYELVIYAFAVHFNALFLVYCATLGLSGFALVSLLIELSRRPVPVDRRGARLAGGLLVAIGAAFGLLWLAEDLPAVLRNAAPRSLIETGLLTNPVHVIDLAFVLPAHVLAGVLIWRRLPAGEVAAPVVLAFGALMSASIAGMMVAIGGPGLGVASALFVLATVTAGVLARVLYPRFASAPTRTTA
jgi:hypothetical protein